VIPALSFRGLEGETDYPHLLKILTECFRADRISESISLGDVTTWYAPSDGCDISREVMIFSTIGTHDEPASVIGFSRLRWYNGFQGVRLYDPGSYLLPEYRSLDY
jgi:hypothetical protein